MANCNLCAGGHKHSLGQSERKGPSGTQIGWIIIAGIAYLMISKVGGFFGDKKPPPPVDLPNAGSGIPQDWSPRPITQELYDTLKGGAWNFALAIKRDAALLLLIGLPSNDMFTAVYNDFTQNFGGGDTLRQWIDKEYFIAPTITTQLDAKFTQLGLSGKPMGSMYDYANDPNQQAFNWSQDNWKQQFVNAAGSLDNDLMINPNQPW